MSLDFLKRAEKYSQEKDSYQRNCVKLGVFSFHMFNMIDNVIFLIFDSVTINRK